jgi:hypothetical protein
MLGHSIYNFHPDDMPEPAGVGLGLTVVNIDDHVECSCVSSDLHRKHRPERSEIFMDLIPEFFNDDRVFLIGEVMPGIETLVVDVDL